MKKEDITPDTYICTKPFEWFDIAWDKSVYSCCPGWINKPIGKMPEQKPEEIWNSETARKIRESVLDGSFRYCNPEFCLHLTEKTWPVKKAREIDIEHYIKLIDSPEPPSMVNCSYDKSCNLACPTCRDQIIHANRDDRESYDQLMQDLLDTYGPHLTSINITGSGDPFGSRHFWDLLQSGVLSNFPKLKIRLHTNAQLFDEFHWERIKPLHQQISAVEISIDASTAETYSINRYPGDWNKLINNMAFISELRKSGQIDLLQLDYVVQKNNWREMPEFVRLGQGWGADRIVFSSLNNWGTFSPQEYEARAVHATSHPENRQLLKQLKDPIFQSLNVFIGFIDQKNYEEKQEGLVPVINVDA